MSRVSRGGFSQAESNVALGGRLRPEVYTRAAEGASGATGGGVVMRVLLLIVGWMTVAGTLSAQGLGAAAEQERRRREAVRAQDWQEFKPASGDFKVLFPYAPLRKRDAIPGLTTMMDLFVAFKQERSFAIWEGEIPKEEMAKSRKEFFDEMRQGILDKGKAQILDEKPVTLGANAGRELHYKAVHERTGDELSFRARLFVIKDRLFVIVSVAKSKDPDTPATDKFFSSFQILR